MNYELAKKLKEAGFPQRKETFHNIGGINFGTQVDDGTEEGVTIPTLSELIEACSNEHCVRLTRFTETHWLTEYISLPDKIEIVAKTADEAMANLWFALNDKDASPDF